MPCASSALADIELTPSIIDSEIHESAKYSGNTRFSLNDATQLTCHPTTDR